ncbi:MAG: Kelch repeat-containing protein [Blastocatellia bacterium]
MLQQTAKIALLVFLLSSTGAPSQVANLAVVSSASYQTDGVVAAEMIAAGFTSAIGNVTAVATSLPLPTVLASHSVVVRDGAGVERLAGLFAVAPGQINFQIPPGTADGMATVALSRDGQVAASGSARVGTVAPGIYTANATGRGAPAGLLLKVDTDGSRTFTSLFLLDSGNRSLPQPFDPSEAGAQLYLVLFGTGIRGNRNGVSATIGSLPLPVLSAGPQGDFVGLDQVYLGPLPVSLAGKLGEAEVRITADGAPANPVTVAPTLPLAGQWGARANLLEPNSEMGVAEVGGKIYVLGGYPPSRVTVNTAQVYDPATNDWSLAAPMPAAVNHSMPAVVNGKLYVIGGQSDSGNTSFVDTVFEYDPATGSWRARAPLPIARSSGAAAVVDGKIYVAGGRPPRGGDFAVYDPATNQWTTLPNLPTQRNHLAAVAIDGKVYVVGGRFAAGANSEVTDVVEVYDPKTNAWSRGTPLPKPRGGINAVEARGCLHVFGGEGNTSRPNGLFDDHDVYDPASRTWVSLAPMPIPVHGVTGAVFLGGLIYLPGGGVSQGGSSGGTQHQVYRPRINCR